MYMLGSPNNHKGWSHD